MARSNSNGDGFGWLQVAALLAAGVIGYVFWWRGQREHRYDKVILGAARRYQIEPALVKAVVWKESWFNPVARGRAGEIGLMQLREPAAFEWAEAEKVKPFDHDLMFSPATNTLAGAWYLAKLMRRYTRTDNPIPYALADYNAGRGHVLRWNKGAAATNSAAFLAKIDFPTTRDYIIAVTQRRLHYQPEYANK